MRFRVAGLFFAGFGCLIVVALTRGHIFDVPAVPTGAPLETVVSDRGESIGSDVRRFTFAAPIDALSIQSESKTMDLEIRALDKGAWSEWQRLQIEDEQDPELKESNLTMFDTGVGEIEVRGTTTAYTLHAIRVSAEPLHTQVAATNGVDLSSPRIISRREWGVDEELMFTDTKAEDNPTDSEDNEAASVTNSGETSARIQDCEAAQRNYPNEFKVATTIRTKDGRTYRWPLQYVNQVKMLVVHHTAIAATGETRSGEERMRALYAYHSINRGWGDIGYNYVIDNDGHIFEGKEGGPKVVAGHAYCNNIGTAGISLMGNFDIEQPTQKQIQSLQWLLNELADEYSINLNTSVVFHGKTFASPIVGHGDLLSTDCPGFVVKGSLAQIRQNVISGNYTATVKFPAVPVTSSSSSRSSRSSSSSRPRVITKPIEGLQAPGSTTISMNPGGRQRISLYYTASSDGARARSRLGQIKTSDKDLGLWLETGDGTPTKLTNVLLLMERVKPNEQVAIPLIVQAPLDAGDYWFEVGGIRFDVMVQGRRTRTTDSPRVPTGTVTQGIVRNNIPLRPSRTSSSSSSSSSAATSRSTTVADHTIRILLTALSNPTISFGSVTTTFTVNGSRCEAIMNGSKSSLSVLRIDGDQVGAITLSSGDKSRVYRGIIECRIENGAPIIINELSLEDYLMGLSEEPDTEPYEKQRAFAIAARSYALFYIDSANRKFEGKPYDGSDSPATFQAYAGKGYEQNNPSWLNALATTAGQVLTVNNKVIKVPYFSSDDGRTRSPAEVGWSNFPNAAIFSSKSDPWCKGMANAGHGVGMSGCGAEGQANQGKTGEQILQYYYPGTLIKSL